MKPLALTILITLITVGPATAKVYNCTFENFSQLGHSQSNQRAIVISYTGEKFHLDTKTKLVTRGWANGWAKPNKIQDIQKTGKFTAYVWNHDTTDVKGKTLSRRFSYRIYKDGSARAHVSVNRANYGTLKATGNCS